MYMGSSDSGQGPVADYFVNGFEFLSSVRGEQFTDQLSYN